MDKLKALSGISSMRLWPDDCRRHVEGPIQIDTVVKMDAAHCSGTVMRVIKEKKKKTMRMKEKQQRARERERDENGQRNRLGLAL